MDLQILLDALISLIPPALVGVLFYVIMRGIFRADATERKIYAQMEADMRAEQEALSGSAKPAPNSGPKLVAKAPKKTPSGTQKVSKSTNK
jgi:hypothetical protein